MKRSTLAADQGDLKAGDYVYPDGENVQAADSTAGNLLGMLAADYDDDPSTQTVYVLIPENHLCEIKCTNVESGTATSADENAYCDLNSEDGIAIDTDSKQHFWVVKVIDSDTVILRQAARPENVQVDTT